MGSSRLGSLLVKEGLLSKTDCETVRRTCGHEGGAFARGILALGLVGERELADFLAKRTRSARAPDDLRREVSAEAVASLDTVLMAKLAVVPLDTDEGPLRVATADPLDQDSLRQLEFFTGRKVTPVVATVSQIEHQLRNLVDGYERTPSPLERFLQHQRVPARPAVETRGAARRPAPVTPSRPAVHKTAFAEEEPAATEAPSATAFDDSMPDPAPEEPEPPAAPGADGESEEADDEASILSDLSASFDDVDDESSAETESMESPSLGESTHEEASSPPGDSSEPAVDPGDGESQALSDDPFFSANEDSQTEAAEPDVELGAASEAESSEPAFADEPQVDHGSSEPDADFSAFDDTLKEVSDEGRPADNVEASAAGDLEAGVSSSPANSDAESLIDSLDPSSGGDDLLAGDQTETQQSADPGTDDLGGSDDLLAGDQTETQEPADPSTDDLLGNDDQTEPDPEPDPDPLGDISLADSNDETESPDQLDPGALADLQDAAQRNTDEAPQADLMEDLSPADDLDPLAEPPPPEKIDPVEEPAVEEPETNEPTQESSATEEPDVGLAEPEEPAAPAEAPAPSQDVSPAPRRAQRTSAFNRALVSASMTSNPKEMLGKAAEAFAKSGVPRAAVFRLSVPEPKELGSWDWSQSEDAVDAEGARGFSTAGLENVLSRLDSDWTPFEDVSREANLAPFEQWRERGDVLLALRIETPSDAPLAVVAGWNHAAAEDTAIKAVSRELVKHLARRLR